MSKKPNILVIMGDDIGITNLSCYSQGLMGYRTPNIDRIAKEGVLFTDMYAEQSCTAGRAAFITGQNPLRSGLTKVGSPGSDVGILDETPTLAHVLRDQGYRTGQFGKNHFGDQDHHLPTNHGFDEFFGILYHLNALEQPEDPDFPTEDEYPGFMEEFGPRGVIHSYADGRVEDKGQMTMERMVHADEEFGAAAQQFIRDAVAADEPFFVWHNTTHMHYITHPKPESEKRAGRWQSPYHDTMCDHDDRVGELLGLLDELDIAEDTVVVYTTDNGAHVNYWPDGATTPFRSEKNTNWEGAFRVPCVARFPGRFQENEVLNGIFSLTDWMVTLAAIGGDETVKERLREGATLDGRDFRVHIDGFDQRKYLAGQVDESARDLFVYINDDGQCVGIRWDNWKAVFMEQDVRGTYAVWVMPFVMLRMPKLFNLRTDPFERADITSNTYWDWHNRKQFILMAMLRKLTELAGSFKEFPPQQAPQSYNLDEVVQRLRDSAGAH
ncbi:MAG: arylsulfatase [Actinobacteria bacterium]|nr:arylsulfatase [Actinomycetota bacterium]MCB9390273.1 arylsulfatase [Acidimicrobiia bacterium]